MAEDVLGAGPAAEVGDVDVPPDGGGTFETVVEGPGDSAGEVDAGGGVDEGGTTLGAGAVVGADLVRSESPAPLTKQPQCFYQVYVIRFHLIIYVSWTSQLHDHAIIELDV